MQSQSAPQQVPPTPPPPPSVTVTTSEAGRPVVVQFPQGVEALSSQELRALRIRQDALGEQLASVQQRRAEVAAQLRTADPEARPGLQDRMTVLDERIVRIESEIAETGQQLASVPASLATAVERESRPSGGGGDEEAYFGGLATAAVLVGFYALYRRIRRGRRPRERQAVASAEREQLTRLEQAVDAIAVEVERIAEGQRFTAKLMAETHDRRAREAVGRNASETL